MSNRKNNPNFRLSTDLKKAIHSSDEYDDYITLHQFLTKQQSVLAERMKRIVKVLADFETSGGKIKTEDKTTTIELGKLRYTVTYREDETVEKYTVENPDEQESVEQIHKIFFAGYILPLYESKLNEINKQLTDLDNDNTLKGIFEIRKAIRRDKYLTTAAISGTVIQSEDDVDPLGIFGDD